MQQLSPEFLAQGLIWYIVFLFSTTCHEASHSLAAKWGGDLTAFHGGQVTLNPIPHMRREPFGMMLVPIFSFLLGGWMIGWASAPYDPFWQARYPRRAAWMSLAGPGANFALMLIAAIGIRAGMAAGVFQQPSSAGFTHITEAVHPESTPILTFAAMFISVLFFENLLLGTFNLLPVPPLDGSTGITVLMSERAALRFLEFIRDPTFSMAGIIAAWFLFDKLFDPIFTFALNVLYPGAGYG
ncbi:MAG TPA: site-2 protease family protein [Terriglobia bacterium]|jgi:Zn-dependent protease